MQEFSPEDIATSKWPDATPDYLNLSLDADEPDDEEGNPDLA